MSGARTVVGLGGPGGPAILSRAISACRVQFLAVGAFSGVVNLLQLTASLYMMLVFDRVLATRNLDTLVYLTIVAVFALCVLAVLEAVRSLIMQRVGTWIEASVSVESFSRGLEAEVHGRPYRMEALRDVTTCRTYLGSPGLLALFDAPWVPVYLAVIFMLHPIIGWIALCSALALFGLTVVSELVTSKLLREANGATTQSLRRAEAMSRNAEVIDSMGMGPAVTSAWRESAMRAVPPQLRAMSRAAYLLSLTKFLRMALQIAVLGVGAWLVLQQQMTAGASIAASIIVGRALAPVEQLIGSWQHLIQARQAYLRLRASFSQPRLRPPGMPLPAPKGHLVAERLTFNFPGQGSPLIKGIGFELEAGESLAVIGPSAAGKTTLVRMLIGTLAPGSGAVRLDGADVFNWQREDFGRYVGYLPQGVELFEGSVFRNIARMGSAPAEAVFAAAKLAGCHEMILRLPQGYDTEIGEGGQHLSGGQRQLIGLARAMFGDPRLVVLDEPNSNLDGDSEVMLVQALEALKRRGTTVVVVSHRPSLVQAVDKVLLLEQGATKMFGPRAEVLKRLLGPRSAEVAAQPAAAPAQ